MCHLTETGTDLTADAPPAATRTGQNRRCRRAAKTQCRPRVKAVIADAMDVVLRLEVDRTDILRCERYVFRQLIVRVILE